MASEYGFGDLPEEFSGYDGASVVILPVPYDGTSTWMKGADRGPDAIIEASGQVELYDIETGSEPYLSGIFTDVPVTENSSPKAMAAAVEARVSSHLARGKFVVTLGGEHSVSIGAALAHRARFEELTVLQLDAHADLRDEYHGSRYNHACVMSRIKERCPIVQAGIRSMDRSEKDAAAPGRIFYAHETANDPDWMDRLIAVLTKNVYITIDLDVLDPSVMPNTGTPEPGGLGWYDAMTLLRRVSIERRVAGFDVVELCPDGHNRYADFTAAKLIYKTLAYVFQGENR